MRSFDELQRLWERAQACPRDRGTVRGICLRLGGDRHEATPRVELSRDDGVVGDRWQLDKDPERRSQVTIINKTIAELVAADHRPFYDTGDNLHVDLYLGEDALPVGARLRVGEALLQVTPEPHTGCSKFSARFGQDTLRWVNWKDHRSQRLRGLHCEVLEPGAVRVGDEIALVTT